MPLNLPLPTPLAMRRLWCGDGGMAYHEERQPHPAGDGGQGQLRGTLRLLREQWALFQPGFLRSSALLWSAGLPPVPSVSLAALLHKPLPLLFFTQFWPRPPFHSWGSGGLPKRAAAACLSPLVPLLPLSAACIAFSSPLLPSCLTSPSGRAHMLLPQLLAPSVLLATPHC